MPKKSIEFSAKIDLSEFERSVETMQKKLSQITGASDRSRAMLQTKERLSGAGFGSAPTTQDKNRANNEERQSQRQLDSFIKQQIKDQEKLTRELKEQLSVKQKTAEVESRIVSIRTQLAAKDTAINSALDQRSNPNLLNRAAAAWTGARAGGGGILNAAMAGGTAMGRGLSQMSPAALAMGGLGIAGQIAGVAGAITGGVIATPLSVAQSQAATVQAFSDRQRIAMNRGTVFDQAFGAERARAAQATPGRGGLALRDFGLAAGGIAAGAGAGAALGGQIGAIGGLPGAGIGAIAGGVIGAGSALIGSKPIRDYVFSGFDRNALTASLDEERGQMYQSRYQAEIEKTGVKKYALDRYKSEFGGDLALQRSTGLSDQAMMNLYANNIGAGFGLEETRSAAGGILGAGGATGAAVLNSKMALQMGRMGLAGGNIIGGISGMVGAGSGTESATLRMMSEAMSMGMNRSEMNKAMQVMTQAVVSSGTTTSAGAASVISGMGRFFPDSSQGGITAAQNAYQAYQQLSGQGAGYSGAIKASLIQKDPNLSKLSSIDRNTLLQLSDEDIRAGGPTVEYLAGKAGLSVEDFQQRFSNVQTRSLDKLGLLQEKDKSGKTIADKLKETKARLGDKAMQDKEYRSLLGEASTKLMASTGKTGNLRGMETMVGGLFGGDVARDMTSEAAAALGQMPDTAAERTQAAMAKDDAAYLTEIAKITPNLGKMNGAIDKTVESLEMLAKKIVETAGGQDPKGKSLIQPTAAAK